LVQLIKEIKAKAAAGVIPMPPDVVDNAMAVARLMPNDNYSSMHYDVQTVGETEMKALTKNLVDEGERLQVRMP
jgi:ketopantoate reductase